VLPLTNDVTPLVTSYARRAENTLEKEQLSPVVQLLPHQTKNQHYLDSQRLLTTSYK
jgi:hypothetical protein